MLSEVEVIPQREWARGAVIYDPEIQNSCSYFLNLPLEAWNEKSPQIYGQLLLKMADSVPSVGYPKFSLTESRFDQVNNLICPTKHISG